MAFSIKQDDTAPSYIVQLTDETTSAALDLTNATTVLFKMRLHGGTGAPKVSHAMTVLTPKTNGQAQYDWQVGDTDTVGNYDVEFEITWNDATVETIPNDSYLTVTVVDDLDH